MSSTPTPRSPSEELTAALTRVAASPGRTRHLHEILGTYCHQARNVLNCLSMSLYLSRRGSGSDGLTVWTEVEAKYRAVEQFLDRVQSICRPMSLCAVRLPFSLLIEDRAKHWEGLLSAVQRRLILDPPVLPVVASFDPVRLGEAFEELVHWRVRVGPAGSVLRLRWAAVKDNLVVTWDELPARLQPCESFAASALPDVGSGLLTIPLLTRIVSLHGGTLEVFARRTWRIVLCWPLASRTHEGEGPC